MTLLELTPLGQTLLWVGLILTTALIIWVIKKL
jgi:hypothetical protein